MADFELSGLDELQNALSSLADNVAAMEGTHEVPFEELFDVQFMSSCSKFSSISDFFEAGNFIIESEKDFEAIPEAELDAHVASVTIFQSWEEMLEEATAQYVARQLAF